MTVADPRLAAVEEAVKDVAGTIMDQLRNYITVPKTDGDLAFNDGSLVRTVGSVMVSVVVGVMLWLGLLVYLRNPSIFTKPHRANRKNSMLDILANTVERGVAQQALGWHNKRQRENANRRISNIKSHPNVSVTKIPANRRIANIKSRPNASATKIPANRRISNIKSRPNASATKIPLRILRAKIRTEERGHAMDILAPRKDIESPTPYNLPGSFVELPKSDRKMDDVVYYFEVPSGPPQIPPPRRRPPQQGSRRRVSGWRGRNPQVATIQHQNYGAENKPPTEIQEFVTVQARRPWSKSVGHSGQDIYYTDPPPELLNPRPNIWRGSGIDQVPSARRPSIWRSLSAENHPERSTIYQAPVEENMSTQGKNIKSSVYQDAVSGTEATGNVNIATGNAYEATGFVDKGTGNIYDTNGRINMATGKSNAATGHDTDTFRRATEIQSGSRPSSSTTTSTPTLPSSTAHSHLFFPPTPPSDSHSHLFFPPTPPPDSLFSRLDRGIRVNWMPDVMLNHRMEGGGLLLHH